MRICRFLGAVLTASLLISAIVPAYAEEANRYNVMLDSHIKYVGLDEPHSRGGVYQDIYNLVDNEWATGPKSEHGNYAAQIYNASKDRYDINGKKTKSGTYAAIITFTLPEASTVAGFRLIHPDVTGAPGAEDPLDFLLTHFDILGSDSGKSGTWKVLYEARDLRDGSDVEYLYHGLEGSNGIPFWSYEGKFTEEMKVTHIALAIHALNVETNMYGKYMNIHEVQAFTPEYYAVAETEETEAPITTEPPNEPLTVEDFIPKSPVAITAIASVLATVCAVGCVLRERKKEKKY